VVTVPGEAGELLAFVAEVLITFLLMSVVLQVSNSQRWSNWTGICVGLLVATYITFETPFSGMSMNPARTFASSVVSGNFTGWWIYFTAPPLGMLLAARTYLLLQGRGQVKCAKLIHSRSQRCIFCGYQPAVSAAGK